MAQDAKTIMQMEKSLTEKQQENQRVDSVINKISAELKSINSIIRAFIEIAEQDSYANYMLETICDNKKDARIVYNVNEIKKYIIKAYPYKDGNTMLVKDGDLFIPMEKYNPTLIKKAFFGIVRPPKKDVVVIPATEEQIEQHLKAKKDKQIADKVKRESEKESVDTFIKRLMDAGNQELCWAIVQEFKANREKKEEDKK